MAIDVNGVGRRLNNFILNLPSYSAGNPLFGIGPETYLPGDILYEGNSVYVATATTQSNPVGNLSGDWLKLDVNATQWFDGTGAPLANTGGDPGDFYVDNNNGDVYRKLDDNTWPVRKVLQFDTAVDTGFAATTRFSPAALPADTNAQTTTFTVTIADNFVAEAIEVNSVTNIDAVLVPGTMMSPVLTSQDGTHPSSDAPVYKQFTYEATIQTLNNTSSTITTTPSGAIYRPTGGEVVTIGTIVGTVNILNVATHSRNVFYRGWVPNQFDVLLMTQAAVDLIENDAQLDNDEQAVSLGTNFQTDADEFDEATDSSYCIALPTSIGVQGVNAVINLNGEQRIPLTSILSRTVQTIPASNGYAATAYAFFLIDTRSSMYASLDHIESQQLEVV